MDRKIKEIEKGTNSRNNESKDKKLRKFKNKYS